MEDVNISKYRASVVREGSKPASPGFVVSEGQSPTDPAGSGQNHLPVTITPEATGLSITENQVLGGAGTVAQYIRGDGSLADFPESSGGGSSVSYYLNGSVNQGTIGGVAYKELNKVPILGAGTQFTISADGYIASFLTDAGDPNLLEIPGGNWNFETYFSASSSGGTPNFYVELYKYDGTTFTLIASSSSAPELIAFGTTLTPYFSSLAVPTTTLALTDRLAVRYYVNHSGRTITMHTENNTLCQIITTFTTGLTALNGLTAQVQNFAVGTTGTDFNIASATATHTFNLPTASATNRGALSSGDWTTFNNKQNALGFTPVPETRTITINGTTQDLSANRTYNVGTVTSVAALTLGTSGTDLSSTVANGTTTPVITLNVPTASASNRGALSSADWSTFNGKQNALTLTTTGSSGAATLVGSTLNIPIYSPDLSGYVPTSRTITINGTTQDLSANRTFNVGTVTSVGLSSATSGVTIGSTPVTGSGTITLAIATASGSQNGLLSSTDWTTFNNKQNALTNPVTGTGTAGQVAYWSSSSAITGESNLFWDATNDRLGIGNANPGYSLDVIAPSATDSNIFRAGMSGISNGFTVQRVSSNFRYTFLDGNVGIGTNGPSAMLTLLGLTPFIRIERSGVNTWQIQNNNNVGTITGFSINNVTAGTTPFFINQDTGNLLLGATADNGFRLDVNGTGRFSGNVSLQNAASPRVSVEGNTSTGFPGFNLSNTTQGYEIIVRGNISNTFQIRNTTASTDLVTITSSGNLGLGVTPSAWSVYRAFQLGTGIAVGGLMGRTDGVNEINFGLNWTYTGGASLTYIASSFATNYYQKEGTHIWQTAPSGTAGNAISFTQAMTLTSGGNLLVGTTSDNGARLQVSGTAAIGAGTQGINTDADLTLREGVAFVGLDFKSARTSGNVGGLRFYNTSSDSVAIAQQLIETDGKFVFYNGTSGAEARVTITSGGNVGIGTASPGTKLSVYANNPTTGIIFEIFNNATSSQTGAIMKFTQESVADWGIGQPAGTNAFAFWSGTYPGNLGTERARITSGGNLLVGTTTDNGARLQVSGTATVSGAYGTSSGVYLSGTTYGTYGANRGATSASAGMGYFSVGSQRWFTGIYENSDNFGFYSVGTNGFPLVINYSSGNVLIGTTTDVGARLHVNGDIRTAAPSGGSAVNWKLGTARGGTITPNAIVRVEIAGVLVDLDARYV
jgi:hypothetical protein